MWKKSQGAFCHLKCDGSPWCALSLTQTRGFPGQEVTFPAATAAMHTRVTMKALGWTSGRKERSFCTTRPLRHCCRAEFPHWKSLSTCTEVTKCILIVKIYKRHILRIKTCSNNNLFFFSSRWPLHLVVALYPEYLHVHTTSCIFFGDFHFQSHGILHMETVCHYCTTLTKTWLIKKPIPTAQLIRFCNCTFLKDYSPSPGKQSKARQNQSSPIQLAFVGDLFQ